MVADFVLEVGADKKDDDAEATGSILVRDEAVAWRQKNGRSDLVGVLAGKHRHTCDYTTDIPVEVEVEVMCRPSFAERAGEGIEDPSLARMITEEGTSDGFRTGQW